METKECMLENTPLGIQNITPIYFINPTHQDQGHLTYAIITSIRL